MFKILAVDDERPLARAVQRILTRAGHEVTGACSGEEALAAIAAQNFDVAIVDYHIPAPDGLEVLQHLRDAQPECMRILASGRLDLPVVVNAVNCGEISRVLGKPFMPEDLIDAVDQVMSSRNRVANASKQANERERKQLEECLAGESVQLALQPIVATTNLKARAYEALLRSTHPELNGPGPVLGAAERLGMLNEVADVVADRAERWLRVLPSDMRLFINVHPEELRTPDALQQRLKRLEPCADRVVLEITERSNILDFDSWQETATMLSDMGFALAVDDLGSGYSALSMLAALQPQYIKVDMSIVRDVDADARKRNLIEFLCRFANSTNSVLIAEGVETQAEADTLIEIGADLLQGYHFGAPSLELKKKAA